MPKRTRDTGRLSSGVRKDRSLRCVIAAYAKLQGDWLRLLTMIQSCRQDGWQVSLKPSESIPTLWLSPVPPSSRTPIEPGGISSDSHDLHSSIHSSSSTNLPSQDAYALPAPLPWLPLNQIANMPVLLTSQKRATCRSGAKPSKQ